MDIENVLALAGITLAALLSAFGFFWRNRIEIKKSTRKVLYYLLEIRYAIHTSLIDPAHIYKKYIQDMTSILEARDVEIDLDELNRVIAPAITQYLINISDSVRVNIDEKILIPYEAALLELATINPVLAYHLKDKEKIQDLLNHNKNYVSHLNTELLPNLFSGFERGKEALAELGLSRHEKNSRELSAELDKDILKVSRSCGLIDYLRCRHALKRSAVKTSTIDTSDLNDFIDECFNALKSASLAHKAENSSSSPPNV